MLLKIRKRNKEEKKKSVVVHFALLDTGHDGFYTTDTKKVTCTYCRRLIGLSEIKR